MKVSIKIRKPPLLMNKGESLTKKVKRYSCLFDKGQKAYKQRDVVKRTL